MCAFLFVNRRVTCLAKTCLARATLVIRFVKEPMAGARCAPATWADKHHVRGMQRSLTLDNATRLVWAALLHVALDDIQALDNHTVFGWQRFFNLAALAFIFAGDNQNFIASFNLHNQTPFTMYDLLLNLCA